MRKIGKYATYILSVPLFINFSNNSFFAEFNQLSNCMLMKR